MTRTLKGGHDPLDHQEIRDPTESLGPGNNTAIKNDESDPSQRTETFQEAPRTTPLSQRNVEQANENSEKSPQTLYEEGLDLLSEPFKRLEAYHKLLHAYEKGSVEAKKFLGIRDHEITNSPSPLSQPNATRSNIDISQHALLKKLSLLLEELHLKNPKNYSEDTIKIIKNDLTGGHCSGLTLYFLQLSLSQDPQTGQKLAHQYYDFVQKILTWEKELQEWPEGMTWEKLATLPQEEQERIRFTYELTEFISLIRFYQQRMSEVNNTNANESNDPSSQVLQEAKPVFFDKQKDFSNSLEDSYQVRTGGTYKIRNFDIEQIKEEILYNLTEDNTLLFSFKTKGDTGHIVSFSLRGGKYHYFDSNLTSLEETYSTQHSAAVFDNFDELLEFFTNKYNSLPTQEGNQIYGLIRTFYLNKKDKPHRYLPLHQEIHRHSLIQIHHLFNFPMTSDQRHFLEDMIDKQTLSDSDIQTFFSLPEETINLYPKNNPSTLISLENITLQNNQIERLLQIFPRAILTSSNPNTLYQIAQGRELWETKKLTSKTLKYLEEAALKKSVNANLRLAQLYLRGEKGIKINISLAEKYAHKASELGSPEATYLLYSICLQNKQFERVCELLKKASDLGHREAKYQLGLVYLHGRWGVDQDYPEAGRLFRDCYYLGDSRAGKEFANMVEHGLGTEKNPELAAIIRSYLR